MNRLLHAAIIALVALAAPTAFAQQSGASSSPANASKTLTPAEFDQQVAKMQEQMTKMQEEMNKIQQTQDPKERQRLLQDHWTSMQSMMTMMHSAWGGMMPPCCGPNANMTGGHMMGMGGPMMMWGSYQNLTPEQLKQRQYMMDRWVPMQQMMMDHMMWHQHWMMQPPAPPASMGK